VEIPHAQQKATSKEQPVDYRASLLTLRAIFKLELPHLAGEEADQAAAAEG
jgi:hypothetical protein